MEWEERKMRHLCPQRTVALRLVLTALLAVASTIAALPASAAPSAQRATELRIAYQVIPNAESIAKQLKLQEEAMPGVNVRYIQFESGRDVNTAMASGSVDVGLAGSSAVAAGIAQGLPYDVLWIHDVIGDAEALMVKKDRNIKSAADLVGKKVAAPFGSTTHYSLLGYLSLNGIDPSQVNIIDMNPSDMLAAWLRGDIDAGYVWEPTLSKMRADGEVLVSSASLSTQGYATYDLGVIRRDFAKQYPEAVSTYLKTLMRANDIIASDPNRAAEIIAAEFNTTKDDAAAQMNGLLHPGGREQVEKFFLSGTLANDLKKAADFLVTQQTIRSAPDQSTYNSAVNAQYLQGAMQ